MINLNKRGQMTIFIIVAIIIVISILLIYLYRPGLLKIFEGEISPISFLTSCIKPEVESAISVLAKNGGYQSPDRFSLYRGEKVQYLCYTNDYYETCIVQQPMIKQNFENQLNNMIKNNAAVCMRNLISEYDKRGYKVSSGEINSETSIAPNKILIKFNSPLSVSKETTQKFESFDVEIESEMYDLLFIAQSIIEYEAKLGDSASELYLQYYPNLKIEKTKLDDGTKIYKLSDVITKEEFIFASRSLAWPAGYGLEDK